MLHDVEAVVLVGGKGTRLRPLTLSAPKPMLPTAGVPFLAHLLSRIREAGVQRVVLGTSYLAETSPTTSATGADIGPGDRVRRRGPAAGHRRRHPQRGQAPPADDVLVFNGDVLAGMDLTRRRRHAPSHEGRRHPAPRPRAGPAGVRLRAHRRRRAGDGVPGEDRGPADRPDQRRLLRLPPRGDRLDPRGPAGVGGARDVPGAAGGGRAGVRARRRRLLAGPGHPDGLRARLGGPGPRRRAVGRAARPDRRVADPRGRPDRPRPPASRVARRSGGT